ncbi:hypothetical protein L2X99_16705 [Microbacterium sp. KUDC0406]|uniref:hypothetical protein n=1 Tax=Microbacterium sp. KUDC0406 TaxID=2909588 RepID=UPI001F29CC72|nr:hypothetical protein [Microbacterium sp. KUDC0406]UJP09982.1 hypothetical protein L2X99_16705 [Microbacterium sp. KUDC0406]
MTSAPRWCGSSRICSTIARYCTGSASMGRSWPISVRVGRPRMSAQSGNTFMIDEEPVVTPTKPM